MKKIIAFVLYFTLAFSATGFAQDAGPDALVKRTIDEVLSVLKQEKDTKITNKRVWDLVDTKVLPHFNFQRMTQLAVGRPWRDANPKQQEELVKQFRDLLVRTYASALEVYKNQTIDVKPSPLKPADADATVKTVINQPGGQPIAMDYRMEKTGQGWKVYDVSVEGVSIVTTYRSTFGNEVSKGGIDGLIKSLASKNATLEKK